MKRRKAIPPTGSITAAKSTDITIRTMTGTLTKAPRAAAHREVAASPTLTVHRAARAAAKKAATASVKTPAGITKAAAAGIRTLPAPRAFATQATFQPQSTATLPTRTLTATIKRKSAGCPYLQELLLSYSRQCFSARAARLCFCRQSFLSYRDMIPIPSTK